MSSANLEAFLKKEEGWNNKAYPDSGNVWTIGYGRTMNDDGTPVKAGQTTTVKAENSWLTKRAKEDYDATKSYLDSKGYTYTPGQLDALSSFRYNGGQGMLEQLTDSGTRDWDTIRVKMPQYNKVDQGGEMVAIKGLTNRRNAELGLWGEYSNSSPALNVPTLSPSNLTNNTSLRPEPRPVDLVTTGTTSPTEYKVPTNISPVTSPVAPTTVPPVTYTANNTGIEAAVREANQPVPQVQAQPAAIDSAVAEALQNPTGFPVSNMPDIPAGYNQGTSGIPMPEEGLAQQHLYEEYLRRMSEVQQPLPAPPPVTTTTLPPAQYNDGTEGVSWLDSLRSLFARVPSGPELRQVTTDARNEAYNINGVNTGTGLQVGDSNLLPPSVPQAANSNVPLNYGVPKPGQGYGIENFGEGNIFTNGVQQQAEVPQAEVPQAVTPEGPFLNIPRNLGRGSTLEEAQAAAMERGYVPAPQVTVPQAPTTEFVPQAMPGQQVQAGMGNARMPDNYSGNAVPLPGRNLDVAMGDDGRQRISAKYLNLPVVSEAMALNRQNDGGGTYFRDGDKVKYVATGSVPEVDPTAYKVVTNRSGAVQSVNPNRIDPEKMATITQRFADGKITEEQYQNQKTDYENAILQDNAHKAYLLAQQKKVAADKIESNKAEAAVLDDRIAAAVTAGDTALADALRKKKDALVTSLPPEEKVYSGRGDFGMPVPPPEAVAPLVEESLEDKIITDTIANSTGINTNDPAALKAAGENAVRTSGLGMDSLKSIGSKLLEIFGMEGNDVSRAVGFYLLSRATGASHAGSMRWAGGTVLKQVENRNIRDDAKASAALTAFKGVSGNYTKEAKSKITRLLLDGKLLEAQELMDNSGSKTARGKLGIGADEPGEMMIRKGYTDPVLIFTGANGTMIKKQVIGGKETFVPISTTEASEYRKRFAEDNDRGLRSSLASSINNMNSTYFRQKGTDRDGNPTEAGIYGGQDQQGVARVIMNKSKELGEMGLPNNPLDILDRFVNVTELVTSTGVKKMAPATVLDLVYVGGDRIIETEKLRKDGDEVEMLDSSEVGRFTETFKELFKSGNNYDYTASRAALAKAETNWNPETSPNTVSGVVKLAENSDGISPEDLRTIAKMPNAYTATVMFETLKTK